MGAYGSELTNTIEEDLVPEEEPKAMVSLKDQIQVGGRVTGLNVNQMKALKAFARARSGNEGGAKLPMFNTYLNGCNGAQAQVFSSGSENEAKKTVIRQTRVRTVRRRRNAPSNFPIGQR